MLRKEEKSSAPLVQLESQVLQRKRKTADDSELHSTHQSLASPRKFTFLDKWVHGGFANLTPVRFSCVFLVGSIAQVPIPAGSAPTCPDDRADVRFETCASCVSNQTTGTQSHRCAGQAQFVV